MTRAALQTALYDRLANFGALAALVEGVHDHVPQDAAHPYVQVGEIDSTEWDTDTSLGSDATVTIHVWSRYRGRLQTHEIQDAIYSALHRHALTVTGAQVVTVEFEFADSLLDPDGLTRHGVQRFRILLNQE